MHKVYLHIGYPKTGTTWFQEKLYPEVKDIAFYNPNAVRKILGDFGNRNAPELIQEKIAKHNKPIVLCNENMIGGPKKCQQNAEFYNRTFPSATVILFLRNQVNKYASNYNQYVKSGGTLSIQDYLFLDGNHELVGGERHKYDKLLNIYKAAFGAERVHVYLYEDFSANPQQFMQQFLQRYEFKVDKAVSFQLVNRSLSKNLLSIKRLTNRFTKLQAEWLKSRNYKKKYFLHIPYWHQFSYYLFQFLSYFSKANSNITKQTLGKENIKIIAEYFKASNQALIEKHGLHKIKDYNYPL